MDICLFTPVLSLSPPLLSLMLEKYILTLTSTVFQYKFFSLREIRLLVRNFFFKRDQVVREEKWESEPSLPISSGKRRQTVHTREAAKAMSLERKFQEVQASTHVAHISWAKVHVIIKRGYSRVCHQAKANWSWRSPLLDLSGAASVDHCG
jgi:hypothetical protein